jgi:hypothetical protein
MPADDSKRGEGERYLIETGDRLAQRVRSSRLFGG